MKMHPIALLCLWLAVSLMVFVWLALPVLISDWRIRFSRWRYERHHRRIMAIFREAGVLTSHDAVRYSPGVLRLAGLRMDASVGTPTIWQKIAVALGLGASIGMTPAEIASTQAGDNADVTEAEKNLLGLFQPILHSAESTGLADLQALLTTVLTGAESGSITSVASAVALVKSALATEAGAAAAQAEQIGETSLTTLVSAALASLGKTALPVT